MTSIKPALLLEVLSALLLAAEHAPAWYDPGTQRWLNRDPQGERGGLNLFSFVDNDPLFWVDTFGLDGCTIGPVTIYYNEGSLTPTEKAGEHAHERQHQADFLSGLPGWKREQRAFAAEANTLKSGIRRLEAKPTLTQAERADLAAARSALGVAGTIASDPNNAIDYWNDACRRWYQRKVPHVESPSPKPKPPNPKPPPAPAGPPPPKTTPTP